jgi:hypothetical protein
MPIRVELSSEEISLLKMCVALVLGPEWSVNDNEEFDIFEEEK